MFTGEYISSRSGVSSKNGTAWYQLELIADTLSGGAKILQVFCSENAYNQCVGLRARQRVKVACGVTDSGHITVNAVKGE